MFPSLRTAAFPPPHPFPATPLHSPPRARGMRAALLAALAVATASAMYDASDAVIQLTDKDFDKRGAWREGEGGACIGKGGRGAGAE